MRWFSCVLFLHEFSFVICQSPPPPPLLLLVSFDGFRHDYPKLYGPLANFQRLEQRGIRAPSMTPTFHTATLPNQYTYATGPHPHPRIRIIVSLG